MALYEIKSGRSHHYPWRSHGDQQKSQQHGLVWQIETAETEPRHRSQDGPTQCRGEGDDERIEGCLSKLVLHPQDTVVLESQRPWPVGLRKHGHLASDF